MQSVSVLNEAMQSCSKRVRTQHHQIQCKECQQGGGELGLGEKATMHPVTCSLSNAMVEVGLGDLLIYVDHENVKKSLICQE
jgi:hypothetical protein